MSAMSGTGPLDGVVVLDFTQYQAGPFCTMLLADAGADVIKIEPPYGDGSRLRGGVSRGSSGESLSVYFAAVNRRKRSLTLDLASAAARRLLDRLVAAADVAVENFGPGTATKLGVDLGAMRARNPALITASVTLFGHRLATYSQRAGIAIVAEAESGVGDVTRGRDQVPTPIGAPIADTAAGLAGYAGIVSALVERQRTGVGRHIDISMVGTLFALSAAAVAAFSIAGSDTRRTVPYGYFRTRDGHVAIALHQDAAWQRLALAIGMPELAQSQEFSTHRERDGRRAQVNEILERWTATKSSDEVVEALASANVPCGRLSTFGEILAQPRARALGLLEEAVDSYGQTVTLPSNPMGFHASRPTLAGVGQHNAVVLRDLLGLDAEAFASLAAEGAFG